MPTAHSVSSGGDSRVPRTLWGHCHQDGGTEFPVDTINSPESFILLPDNWNGTSKIRVWIITTEGWTDVPIDVTFDAGTTNEAVNTHTVTVDDKLVTALAIETYAHQEGYKTLSGFMSYMRWNEKTYYDVLKEAYRDA